MSKFVPSSKKFRDDFCDFSNRIVLRRCPGAEAWLGFFVKDEWLEYYQMPGDDHTNGIVFEKQKRDDASEPDRIYLAFFFEKSLFVRKGVYCKILKYTTIFGDTWNYENPGAIEQHKGFVNLALGWTGKEHGSIGDVFPCKRFGRKLIIGNAEFELEYSPSVALKHGR